MTIHRVMIQEATVLRAYCFTALTIELSDVANVSACWKKVVRSLNVWR